MTTRQTRTWTILLGLIFAGWAVACFLWMYPMGCAGLDDWCYLAPGAAATWPLGITAPLLGNFLGADHTWGIHSPGAPLLYSCLFSLVPYSPLARVILFMGLAAGGAVATFLLLRRFLGHPLIAAAGAAVFLSDQAMANILGIARPEVLSTLVLAVLIWLLADLWRGPRAGWRNVAAGVCFFLLPLLHPVLLPLGGLLCVYAGWRAWQTEQTGRGIVFAVCYAAGLGVLVSWYYFQPDAWRQLQVHGRANYAPFGWGSTFVMYLRSYAPFYGGLWLYLLAFAGCIVLRPFRRAADDAASQPPDWTLPVLTLLGGTAAAQLFHNPDYQLILLPETILLAVAALDALVRRWSPRETAAWMLPCLLALAVLSGAFWVLRTVRYFQAGRPNLRAEIHTLALSLSNPRPVLVSDLLWEEGVRQPGHFQLYTPPFACAPDIRQSYEANVLQQTRPGDLLLLNDHDLVTLTRPLAPEQWESVGHYEHRLPSKVFWGYGMTLYRRR